MIAAMILLTIAGMYYAPRVAAADAYARGQCQAFRTAVKPKSGKRTGIAASAQTAEAGDFAIPFNRGEDDADDMHI